MDIQLEFLLNLGKEEVKEAKARASASPPRRMDVDGERRLADARSRARTRRLAWPAVKPVALAKARQAAAPMAGQEGGDSVLRVRDYQRL